MRRRRQRGNEATRQRGCPGTQHCAGAEYFPTFPPSHLPTAQPGRHARALALGHGTRCGHGTRGLGLLVLTLAALGGTAGCGYRNGGIYPCDVQTVYVDMFGSKLFRRNLEFKLTEALKKRISLDTPYRLAPVEKADTILKGELLEERQAAFAPDYLSRQPREKTVVLAARVQWKDLRSGRVLVDQPVELQAADYVPPEGEPEALAQERAIDLLAARIVAKMYEEW
jgi:hypothetical protein